MHNRPMLKSQVFVKQPRSAFGGSCVHPDIVRSAFSAKASEVVGCFDEAAKRLKIAMLWTSRGWPQTRSKASKEIVRHSQNSSLQHLENKEFDADMSVCVVPKLHDVDAAVGQLLVRSRKHLIVLCTVEDLPDFTEQKDRDLMTRISTIPVDSTLQLNGMYMPYGPNEIEAWDIGKTPMKKGALVLRSLSDISCDYAKNILQSVTVQKYGLN